jgi:putative ABC transport system ATP-binding protein
MSNSIILKTQNITVARKKITIFKNVNFNLKKSAITTLTGESGSGKSTFLKTLNALIPFQGKIFFKNKSILDYKPVILRKKICYIPQIPVAISDNIFNEFKLINSEFASEAAYDILEEFKLDNSVLKKNMNNLSVGQQQRIAIIRGILNQPEIMLLDEPTSALDENNIKLLKEIILRLNKEQKMTFLIVTHNLKMASEISEIKYILQNKSLRLI